MFMWIYELFSRRTSIGDEKKIWMMNTDSGKCLSGKVSFDFGFLCQLSFFLFCDEPRRRIEFM